MTTNNNNNTTDREAQAARESTYETDFELSGDRESERLKAKLKESFDADADPDAPSSIPSLTNRQLKQYLDRDTSVEIRAAQRKVTRELEDRDAARFAALRAAAPVAATPKPAPASESEPKAPAQSPDPPNTDECGAQPHYEAAGSRSPSPPPESGPIARTGLWAVWIPPAAIAGVALILGKFNGRIFMGLVLYLVASGIVWAFLGHTDGPAEESGTSAGDIIGDHVRWPIAALLLAGVIFAVLQALTTPGVAEMVIAVVFAVIITVAIMKS